jgi:hypothetical protein
MSTPLRGAIARLTLRHWTTDSQRFVGGPQRPARVPAYSERIEGEPFQRLALKLAQVKSDLARPVLRSLAIRSDRIGRTEPRPG